MSECHSKIKLFALCLSVFLSCMSQFWPCGQLESVLVVKSESNIDFIALIHPIQWTIAYLVGADRPAKRQKKTSCVATSWPVRSTVHSPDGASYFLPV